MANSNNKIPEIKKLKETIEHILETNEKFVDYNTRYLIPPGENYGSLMLAVDVKTLKNNEENIINMVAKLCPPNEWIRRMFATIITFKKEVKFYLEVLPTLTKFPNKNINKKILDIFPKCLGARLNLDNTDNVNDDALLLLENLKTNGYTSVDRLVGFNLPEAEVILRDLATFHAAPLAFKTKNPDIFKKIIMPHLEKINIGQEMFDEIPHRFVEQINRHLKFTGEKFERFEKGMYKGFDFSKNFPEGNEKYVTIVHRDFWLNNTMILYENGVPTKSKILDFQVLTTGSPISDLVFFLFSSIQQKVLEEHYEHLIEVYHKSFVQCLEDLECNIDYYTLENLKKEIDIYGPLEASHVLVMFKAIYADKEAVKELSDFDLEEMFSDYGITETYKARLNWTVNEFFKRHWF